MAKHRWNLKIALGRTHYDLKLVEVRSIRKLYKKTPCKEKIIGLTKICTSIFFRFAVLGSNCFKN